MTTSPTLIAFKETVRDAFGYLRSEFAFREVEPPAKHLEANPFLVCFANATTLVQVEGTNWGFAAQVILGPADTGGRWRDTVPLWAVVKHRRPDLYEEVTRSAGQLGDIRGYAHALRATASDVLRGTSGCSHRRTPSWRPKRLSNGSVSMRRPVSAAAEQPWPPRPRRFGPRTFGVWLSF